MVKEGIGRHLNLVKKDVRVVQIHANRWGVADEVDVVVARGKLLAELRGNDAGAAVSWIAGYADTHGFTVPQDAAARLTQPLLRLAARMAAVFEPRKFRVLVLY